MVKRANKNLQLSLVAEKILYLSLVQSCTSQLSFTRSNDFVQLNCNPQKQINKQG